MTKGSRLAVPTLFSASTLPLGGGAGGFKAKLWGMERHVINTSRAPSAIGPYSQAVVAQGKFLFISGQIGMRPDGTMAGESVEDQTRQIILNLRALLDAAGMDTGNLVKTTIYLRSMADFSMVNEIYGEMVGSEPPARATVEVSNLPKDALVEIEAVAIAGV